MSKSDTFPPPAPPAYKVGMHHALPKGTWITGRSTTGVYGIPSHKDHVFIIRDTWKKDVVYSNAGYHCEVRCVVCQENIRPVDGEFCQIKADDAYLDAVLTSVEEKIKVLRRARQLIGQEMVS